MSSAIATTVAVAIFTGGALAAVYLGDSMNNEDLPDIGNSAGASDTTPAIQARLPNEKQALILEKAKIVLIGRCMKRLGVDFSPEPAINPVFLSLWEGGGLQPLTEGNASKYGYHPAPLNAGDKADGQPADSPASKGASGGSRQLKQWERDAVYGDRDQVNGKPVPDGGCFGESQREIFKSTDRLVGDTGNLKGKALRTETDVLNAMLELFAVAGDRVSNDPRYKQVINQWSLCMNKAGHEEYRHITDAALSSKWQETASATKEEKEVATADARCRKTTNYSSIYRALNGAYQEQVASEHKQFLSSWSSNLATRLGNAQRVLRNT
ncbi:hypothetical protein KVH15_21560 [Streptomyces olivaceus]|uniref:hypothetical protein n=1 Tax=Streptomyces olivaceus TaxID=47716 RepID=UPI001CCD2A6D|nr:hypothetical protein [Streptomyces olivaceus]MBZ6083598.1 hypothetical protein [Streptomyces olivaceus]